MLAFLRFHYPGVAPEIWVERMRKGEVVNEAGVPFRPEHPYSAGHWVFYYRELESETPIPFDERILFQDDHLLVVDKPHFLPVTPSGRFVRETLLVRLKRKLGLDHLIPIHRLDRETAGVMLFSSNPASRGAYQSLFHWRAVVKVYEALAATTGEHRFPLTVRNRLVPGEPFFRMKEAPGAPNAETYIEMVEERGDIARYRLRPVTGRKHQLRLHLAGLGIPILNDAFYPHCLPDKGDDYSRPLQLLAKSIAFADPLDGRERYFESPRAL